VKSPRLTVLAILTSIVLLLTLLGFFTSDERLLVIQWILVRWAVTIAAFAVILGFLNVVAVHIAKLTSRASGWPYSLALIISAIAVLAIGLAEVLVFRPEDGLWGPLMAPVFTRIVVPLQAAAGALLPFILTYAAYRMLRQNRQRSTFVFLFSALVIVIGQLPLPDLGTGLQDFRAAWLAWVAVPGLRAVLIGVALGISITALRVIMGMDRPQG
jgi:hypothetical protein